MHHPRGPSQRVCSRNATGVLQHRGTIRPEAAFSPPRARGTAAFPAACGTQVSMAFVARGRPRAAHGEPPMTRSSARSTFQADDISLKSRFPDRLSREGIRLLREGPHEVHPLPRAHGIHPRVVLGPRITRLHPDHSGREVGTIHTAILLGAYGRARGRRTPTGSRGPFVALSVRQQLLVEGALILIERQVARVLRTLNVEQPQEFGPVLRGHAPRVRVGCGAIRNLGHAPSCSKRRHAIMSRATTVASWLASTRKAPDTHGAVHRKFHTVFSPRARSSPSCENWRSTATRARAIRRRARAEGRPVRPSRSSRGPRGCGCRGSPPHGPGLSSVVVRCYVQVVRLLSRYETMS